MPSQHWPPRAFSTPGPIGRTGIEATSLLLTGLAIALATWQLWHREESAWERIRRTGEARVGYSLEAPFAFRDEQGRVTGEAPTVAAEVLDRLGVERIEWVHSEFANLIPKLKSGRFDLVASGMFRTPEREREVAFSQPTVCVAHGFLVPDGASRGLRDYPDFARRTDARLAVLAGAVEGDYARQAGIPEDRLVVFPDLAGAVKGLRRGVVEALALSDVSVRMAARSWPGLAAEIPERASGQGPDPLGGCAAIAFRHEDKALRAAFDRALDDYLGTEPHLKGIIPFGFGPDNLPDPVRRKAGDSTPMRAKEQAE